MEAGIGVMTFFISRIDRLIRLVGLFGICPIKFNVMEPKSLYHVSPHWREITL